MPEMIASPDDGLIAFFRKNLLEWSARNPRPMPWKGERDPYKVWLSEIILQQTRVEQGMPYYQKFVSQYPRIEMLASAPEDEVMKLWEGLGYYSRARNLHAAAKHIAFELKGVFPASYPEILALKGVGAYTAAAIASFAFGLPHAVLDGNVYRVLSRFFGIAISTNTPAAQKQFAALAQRLLDVQRPAAYNQAIMDFGALICTPLQARCSECPFQSKCQAYETGRVYELPLKTKALTKKKRQFHYLVLQHRGDTLLRKRVAKDIWRGLWEFPLLDGPIEASPLGLHPVRVSAPFHQTLTHQMVTAIFYEIDLPEDTPEQVFKNPVLEGCQRVAQKDLKKKIAFPKVIDCFLQNKALTLN